MAELDNAGLHQRFALLKGAEHHKNALIEVSATVPSTQALDARPSSHFLPIRQLTCCRNYYVVWIRSRKIGSKHHLIMQENLSTIVMAKSVSANLRKKSARFKHLWSVPTIFRNQIRLVQSIMELYPRKAYCG